MLETDDEETEESPTHTRGTTGGLPTPVRIVMCFILFWQVVFHVSDSSVAALVLFFHHFFRVLSSIERNSAIISALADSWPKSISSIYKSLGVDKMDFTQYVVCPKCDSIYDYNDCIITRSDGSKVSKTCKHRPFPQHRYRSKRKPCGAILLQSVKGKKDTSLRPWKVYCYRSLISSLIQILSKPQILSLCEQWRQRSSVDGQLLGDVYDGQLWKDFQVVDGVPFLSSPHSIALSFNTDWFQPFTHTTYSVGVMYIVIQNLPRNIRYKPENVILCGIIPGPKEPEYTINSYLSPLVEDLLYLWRGVSMTLPNLSRVTIRAALLCISCDLPATRKVLGFASFNSSHGCSKCHHHFPHLKEYKKHDFSDFDYLNWVPRSLSTHQAFAQQYSQTKSKSEQKKLVQDHGVRNCVLLKLPYFDPIRVHVIDPMHNLLLGTAKMVTSTWIEEGILCQQKLKQIQDTIEQIHAPVDVGRLPAKVASSFSGFKADQWRNWVLIYSTICLKGVIDGSHLRCWLLFVKACRLICTRSITQENVEVAHSFLVQFCRMFVDLYGKKYTTPNLHMHMHLKECLLDFGPVYAFWCYSYERYNGLLGSYQTNNRSIEPQIMSRFIREQQFRQLKLPDGYPDIECFIQQMTKSNHEFQENKVVTGLQFSSLNSLKFDNPVLSMNFQYCDASTIQLLPPAAEYILSSEYFDYLKQLVVELNPGISDCQPLQLCRRYNSVCVAGEVFGSKIRRTDRNACIAAYWPTSPGSSLDSCYELKFEFVQFYLLYSVKFSGTNLCNYVFAFVRWNKKHCNSNWFGSSVFVSSQCTEPLSRYSFIPVQRLAHRCAHGVINVNFGSCNDNVFVTVPLHSKSCF